MTKNQPETPTTPSNPVSLSVTDISDQMPMCHEDIPMLDIDDLIIPEPQEETVFRHPVYCTQNNGVCDTCPLMVDGFDCHGHLDLLNILEEVDRPEYCSQNGGDCSTCSLVNYGLDCMNNRVSDREVSHG